jgi:hypothetical protein
MKEFLGIKDVLDWAEITAISALENATEISYQNVND